MTRAQLTKQLTEKAEQEGSQAALAAKLGVTPSYLSEIIRGTRSPGKKFLKALGLEKRVIFQKEQAAVQA